MTGAMMIDAFHGRFLGLAVLRNCAPYGLWVCLGELHSLYTIGELLRVIIYGAVEVYYIAKDIIATFYLHVQFILATTLRV